MKRLMLCSVILISLCVLQTQAFQRIFPCYIEYWKPYKPKYTLPFLQHDIYIGKFDADVLNDILVVDQFEMDGVLRSGFFQYSQQGDITFGAPKIHYFPIGDYARGLHCGDLNNDGHIDAVTAIRNRNLVMVCINDGNGNFSEIPLNVGDCPMDVFVADLDGTQGNDIAVVNLNDGSISCLYNDGLGNFTREDYPTDDNPVSIFISYVNDDDLLDIITANSFSGTISVLLNNGNREFLPHVDYSVLLHPIYLYSGRLDNDEFNDIVVVGGFYTTDTHLAKFINDRSGGFEPPDYYPIGEQNCGVSLSDIDYDSDNDVITLGSSADRLKILYNDGFGSIYHTEEHFCNQAPFALSVSDLNMDNNPEIIIQGLDGVAVFINKGFGKLEAYGDTYQTGYVSKEIAAGDFDGDNVDDVVVSNAEGDNISVLLNDGLGKFAPQVFYRMPPYPQDILIADFDARNGNDIAVTCLQKVLLRVNDGYGGFEEEPRRHMIYNHHGLGSCLADFDGDDDIDVVISTYNSEEPISWYTEIVIDTIGSDSCFFLDTIIKITKTSEEYSCGIAFLKNTGYGYFNPIIPYEGPQTRAQEALAVCDVDNDEDMDVCAVQYVPDSPTGPYYVYVYYYNPENGFTVQREFQIEFNPYSIAAGYLNNDPYIDLVVGQRVEINHLWEKRQICILFNDSEGGYTLPPIYYQVCRGNVYCKIEDIDANGYNDIITVQSNAGNGMIFFNLGNGQFNQPYYAYGFCRNPHGLFITDVDDDGDEDVLACYLKLTEPLTFNHMVVNLNSLNIYPQSSYSKMTYPNQGRHLQRVPNTSDLDWVYQSNHAVFWQQMGDYLVEPPTFLTRGRYPSIAKNDLLNPWVSYVVNGDSLKAFIRRSDGTWKESEVIAYSATVNPSSLVLSIYPDVTGEYGELGYVVYAIKGWGGQSYICFSAFDSLGTWYSTVLDEGNVYEPSIAITPKDYIHIVWRKDDRIYYVTTPFGITPQFIRSGGQPIWSEVEQISTPTEPITEPSSNPFVEAQGEWVYAVWRGPNEESPPNPAYGEIWQRRGLIRPELTPIWETPRNVSRTQEHELNYPTMSTGTAVVWQDAEPGNFEIYANILTREGEQIVNISNTAKKSSYPHTNLLPAPPETPEDWRLFSIWTEESIPQTLYRVKYSSYFFTPPTPPDTNIWPLSIPGGDSTPSSYCLERDGFIQFEQMAIDYDSTDLVYILPYLHPKKHYLLEAVAYQDTSGVYRQNFTIGNRGFAVRLRRGIPETLKVIIPPHFYDSTFIILRISRLQGNFTSLARLRLHEFEIVQREKGGTQSDEIIEAPQRNLLYSPFPNPFSNGLKIKYQLSKAEMVSLKVYDISGRVVRVMIDEKKEQGIYNLNFDSKDYMGRNLPIGIYFIRLQTEDYTDTKKVVLMK